MNIKTILVTLSLVAVSLTLVSWGKLGHQKISKQATYTFKGKMKGFKNFSEFIVEHASDPDYRKSADKTEGKKHYIDIDNYAGYIDSGKISVSFEENIEIYGKKFVMKNGILPWATKASYDSLVNCLRRNDLEKAQFFAADLGHYVADGHMPFHTTGNYDGQFSGNKGIHARYESHMVDKYISDFDYKIKKVKQIPDVNAYIFNYLYKNNQFLDSVLHADNYAQKSTGSDESDEYLAALWLKTGDLTQDLFKNASQALANLYYSAWIEAGKPKIKVAKTQK